MEIIISIIIIYILILCILMLSNKEIIIFQYTDSYTNQTYCDNSTL